MFFVRFLADSRVSVGRVPIARIIVFGVYIRVPLFQENTVWSSRVEVQRGLRKRFACSGLFAFHLGPVAA